MFEGVAVKNGQPKASCFKLIMLLKSNWNHTIERATNDDLPGSNGVQNNQP